MYESRVERFSYGNELPRSKLRGINPPLAYSHGPASLAGCMLVYLVYVLHANLRTILTWFGVQFDWTPNWV